MDTIRTDIEDMLLREMVEEDNKAIFTEAMEPGFDMISPDVSPFFGESMIDESVEDILDVYDDDFNL